MEIDRILEAQVLAQQFSKKADALIQETKTEGGKYLLYGSKQSGALRRLSLDLTRKLAEMRNPRL